MEEKQQERENKTDPHVCKRGKRIRLSSPIWNSYLAFPKWHSPTCSLLLGSLSFLRAGSQVSSLWVRASVRHLPYDESLSNEIWKDYPPPQNIHAISSLWQVQWHWPWARLTFDHVYIIGPISDGQRDGLLVPLHQVHHHCLLLGGDPAADDCAALTGQVYEVLLPLFFPSFQMPLTLRPHASFFFCPWELQLQNFTSLGLFLQKNFILWNQEITTILVFTSSVSFPRP